MTQRKSRPYQPRFVTRDGEPGGKATQGWRDFFRSAQGNFVGEVINGSGETYAAFVLTIDGGTACRDKHRQGKGKFPDRMAKSGLK